MDLDIVAYKLKDDLWAFDYEPNGTIEELIEKVKEILIKENII
jgi:hypothetical protein